MDYTYHTKDHYSDVKRYVNQVYKTFKKHKLIRNQEEFSEQILNRSSHYLSMILASEQEFSASSLSHLYGAVKCIKENIIINPHRNIYSTTIKELEKLEEYGLRVIKERIEQTKLPCNEVVVL